MKALPLWSETRANADRVRPTFELPSRSDVVIVGAGYTGLSAARRLAIGGASAIVLERDEIGSGASSRNGGQVLTGLAVDPAGLVAAHGESAARRMFDEARESMAHLEAVVADEAIACEYERTGHIQAAFKPAHFEAFRDEQALLARVFDHRVDLIAREQQRTELGSNAYCGLMVDEASAALNPAQYVDGLARAAERAGARIATRTPVDRVEKRRDGWKVTTDRGSIEAEHVVFATNAYGGPVPDDLRRGIVPIGSYIVATEPLSAAQCATILPTRRMVFDSKHFLYYFRLTADRRLLFGGRAEFGEPTPESTPRAAAVLRQGIAHVFPELANVRIEYAWGGRVAFTRDRLPHAGTLDRGLHFAAGYCGHGIAMATYLGDLVGRRVLGDTISSAFVDDRCPRFPLYDGRPWFLPLAATYYRLKDWLS